MTRKRRIHFVFFRVIRVFRGSRFFARRLCSVDVKPRYLFPLYPEFATIGKGVRVATLLLPAQIAK
jgi:hypothetical protein